jgi:hypothetical protein
MRKGERPWPATGARCVLAFVGIGLLRCGTEPRAYAPTESQLAAVLADTGHVRAWSAVLGDVDAPWEPSGAASGSWDVVSSYLVTTPDGSSGYLSVSTTTLRSGAEAEVFFEHFATWLASPAAAPNPRLNRTWPTPGRTGPEPEQSRDFRQVYPDAQGHIVDRRSRLMRDRSVVALVSGPGAADAGRSGVSEHDRMVAFERTATWVKGRLLRDPARGVGG